MFSLYAIQPCPLASSPVKSWKLQTSSAMNNAFAFWWGHDCAYAQPARMAADLCAHVPVCVIFIAGQPWWMESCVALLGPLVSLRAEAGHLRTMHQAGGWRPGHTLATVCVGGCVCVLLFIYVSTQACGHLKRLFFYLFFSILHDSVRCINQRF